jgi:hypothetical protein
VTQHQGPEPPVELLVADLAEHPERILTAAELKRLGRAGAQLQQWGGFRESERLTAVYCQSCGEDHEVELEFDWATHSYHYFCSSDGVVDIPDDEVRAFRFDGSWLRSRLAQGLRIRWPQDRELIPGVLWSLGEAMIGALPMWIVLIGRVTDHLDGILEALRLLGSKRQLLILTSRLDLTSSLQRPKHHHVFWLRDILTTEGGVLTVDIGSILAALTERTHQRDEPGGGRRGMKDEALALIMDREREGIVLNSIGQEAAAVRWELAARYPTAKINQVRSIENIIRAHRKRKT